MDALKTARMIELMQKRIKLLEKDVEAWRKKSIMLAKHLDEERKEAAQ